MDTTASLEVKEQKGLTIFSAKQVVDCFYLFTIKESFFYLPGRTLTYLIPAGAYTLTFFVLGHVLRSPRTQPIVNNAMKRFLM